MILDASSIKAYSTTDPFDSQVGYSDPQARVGRSAKTYNLGYKLHLSIDSRPCFHSPHWLCRLTRTRNATH